MVLIFFYFTTAGACVVVLFFLFNATGLDKKTDTRCKMIPQLLFMGVRRRIGLPIKLAATGEPGCSRCATVSTFVQKKKYMYKYKDVLNMYKFKNNTQN